jgi:hypothetical protein
MWTLLLLIVGQALAWEVTCADPDTLEGCKNGFEDARTPWRDVNVDGSKPEHFTAWKHVRSRAGLPDSIDEPFQVTNYTVGAVVTGQSDVLDQLAGNDTVYEYDALSLPLPFEKDMAFAADTVVRSTSIGEMTQLPDHMYSLWDWASGAEHCPVFELGASEWDARECHDYLIRQGALNSSHFLPQGKMWWGYYHAHALERAEVCADLVDELESAGQLDAHWDYALACEQQAMMFEGIAQHYLQDAWSTGHMWERWGSTNLDDYADFDFAWSAGLLTGTVHGAQSVIHQHDPLCSPVLDHFEPNVQLGVLRENVSYVDGMTGRIEYGVGDHWMRALLTGTVGPEYTDQQRALISCSANSMREVYATTAELHGALGAASYEVDSDRDPYGDACWGQRATNLAMSTGHGIHLFDYPGQSKIPWQAYQLFPALLHDTMVGVQLVALVTELEVLHNITESLPVSLPPQVPASWAQHSFKMQIDRKWMAWAGWMGPAVDRTDLAQDAIAPLAGMKENSEYVNGDLTAFELPGDYADPVLPWTFGEDFRTDSLMLTFADAYAVDRCETITPSDLEPLRDAAIDAVAWAASGAVPAIAQEEAADAASASCGYCAQMAAPHMRLGTGPSDYDATNPPLCTFGNSPAEYVYSGSEARNFANPKRAAYDWCGCDVDDGLIIPEFHGQMLPVEPEWGAPQTWSVEPTMGASMKHDVEPIVGDAVLGVAVSFPYTAVQIYNRFDPSDVRVLDVDPDPYLDVGIDSDFTGGPTGIDMTAHHRYIVVGGAEKANLCNPGRIDLFDVDTLERVGGFKTPRGVDDVAGIHGPSGSTIAFSMPGSVACAVDPFLHTVRVEDLLDAGVVDTEGPFEAHYVGPATRVTRFETDPTRTYLAFTSTDAPVGVAGSDTTGHVGIVETQTMTARVVSPYDLNTDSGGPYYLEVGQPWIGLGDVALRVEPSQIELYFVTRDIPDGADAPDCGTDAGGAYPCSGLWRLKMEKDLSVLEPTLLDARELAYYSANRLAIGPGPQTMFIGYEGKSVQSVLPLPYLDPTMTLPEIVPAEKQATVEIWLPKGI